MKTKRSTDQPRMECCETKTERTSTFVHGKATVTVRNQSQPVLFERETVALGGTHFPHGQLFQQQINPREWSMGREIESKQHQTRLFLLSPESAGNIIATTYDRLETTSHKWCCTSTGIAKTTVVFVASTDDVLTTK